jgi:hypothetical protein
MNLIPLTTDEVNRIVAELPDKVVRLMKKYPGEIRVGGGMPRSVLDDADIKDIDIFVSSRLNPKRIALELMDGTDEIRMTENALTIVSDSGFIPPIQVIQRWQYDTLDQLLEAFDFTIAQIAISYNGFGADFIGACSEAFRADLKSKRLTYLSPIRDEVPGGSLLRVLKFHRRGYRINVAEYAKVITRMLRDVDWEEILRKYPQSSVPFDDEVCRIIESRLFEVDPNVLETVQLDNVNNLSDGSPQRGRIYRATREEFRQYTDDHLL